MTWTPEELRTLDETAELRISSTRTDGTLRPFVTIWMARSGSEVFVRSAHGVDNGWFRRAKASGRGRIRAGGLERDVQFAPPEGDVHALLDAALHAKYDRYGPGPVGAITGEAAHAATLRLVPLG